eukprot:CAMPEP_0117016610 /NCGR_PEP_ID=MMETSP0472-20121206/13082_1 /TAXON_ID=693140 ORGANISM="Tiarina fusus, Strain LIS" /NCGR_SAMPLE_ID=MMETSP0472 /ASSEMBLY_ACC=CAM_ASM_000603 /LENGTH=130 /DNA_ID=CAMNT_0004720735 /DNA_START=363 /DNA_END=755 /DNA_ORIENTATION=-
MTEVTTLDSELERARRFGLTANVFGFCVWLIYLVAACRQFPPKVFIAAGLFCYIACFFEGFKFWILRSNFFCDNALETLGCSLDTGGNCAISAVVLWFVAGKLICAHTKDRMNNAGEDENDGAPAGDDAA